MPPIVPLGHKHPTRHGRASKESLVLPRDELVQTIKHKLDRSGFCCLIAPTGSGKTFLLRRYERLITTQKLTAFIALEPEDSKFEQFCRRLISKLTTVYPEFEGKIFSQSCLVEHDQYFPLLEFLVDSIHSISKQLTIIIDDAHLLNDTLWFSDFIKLIQRKHSPSTKHWLLASNDYSLLQQTPESDLADLNVISYTALFFSAKEIAKLINRYGTPILLDEADFAKQLHELTRGHPITTMLALFNLDWLFKDWPDRSKKLQADNAAALLQQQTLETLPVDIKQLLINLAFLERFNEELCQFLFDIPSCTSELTFLESSLLFLERFDSERLCYRIRPELRIPLLVKFKQQGADFQNRIISRACTWLIQHGQRDFALLAAKQHNQANFFKEFLRQHSAYWLKSGNTESLGFALYHPELSILQQEPEVSIVLLWWLTLSGKQKTNSAPLQGLSSSPQFNKSQLDLELCLEPAGPVQANLVAIQAMDRLLQDPLDNLSQKTLKQLYNHTSTPRYLRALIDNLFAHHATISLQFNQAGIMANRAHALAEETNSQFGLAVAVYLQTRLHYLNNDLHTAMRLCDRYLNRASQSVNGRALVEAAKAFLMYLGDQPKAAAALSLNIIAQGRTGFANEAQFNLFLPVIRHHGKKRDHQRVQRILQFLAFMPGGNSSETFTAQLMYEHYHFACSNEDTDAVLQLNKRYQPQLRLARYLDPSIYANWTVRERWILAQTLSLIAEKQFAKAKAITKQLLYLNIELGYPIRYPTINMMLSWIEFQMGNELLAYKIMNSALSQIDATGVVNGFLDDIPGIHRMVSSAIAKQKIDNPAHIRKLQSLGYHTGMETISD